MNLGAVNPRAGESALQFSCHIVGFDKFAACRCCSYAGEHQE